MREDLVELLVCPVCRAELSLSVEEKRNGMVITGTLSCTAKGTEYPIRDGVPDLLPRGCGEDR